MGALLADGRRAAEVHARTREETSSWKAAQA